MVLKPRCSFVTSANVLAWNIVKGLLNRTLDLLFAFFLVDKLTARASHDLARRNSQHSPHRPRHVALM